MNLQAITEKFSSNLLGLYQESENELLAHDMHPPRWLQSYIVFCALEKCRNLVTDNPESLYCRFSMGRREGGNPKAIADFLGNLRTLANNINLPPDHLSEHLVDFTISSGTLAQGRGQVDLPEGVKFRLFTAAESELRPSFRLALEDCLKLLDVVAPLKMLIMPSASRKNTIQDRKSRLEKLFNSHAPNQHQQDCQWLILGIPLRKAWTTTKDDVNQLSRQVYTVEYGNNTYSLVDENDWWSNAATVTDLPNA